MTMDAEALQTLFDHAREPKVNASPLGAEGKPFVITRDSIGNENVVYVDQRFDAPARRSGAVALSDAASFVEFFTRFANADSLIYGSMDPAGFVGVLNEHGPAGAPLAPNWRDWRCIYKPTFSREWLAWTGHNGKDKSFAGNVAFAEWLEDQLPDVIQPAGSALMRIALTFKVTEGVTYKNLARLEDGNVDLTYAHSVDGGGMNEKGSKVRIPEAFTIDVPVFAGLSARKYKVDARFRFRLREGGLTIWYELVRPHKVIEQAFADLLAEIQKAAKRTVLFGTP